MPAVPWLSRDEDRAWRGYRRMRTLLDLQIGRDLSDDSALSDSDYDVLSTLTEAPEPAWRARDLAARLLWSTSRLAHHVGRMERRGLVKRSACSDDGRGAVISLTDEGWTALRNAAPLHLASVRKHFINLLTSTEVKALAAMSAKVIAHLDDVGWPSDFGREAGSKTNADGEQRHRRSARSATRKG